MSVSPRWPLAGLTLVVAIALLAFGLLRDGGGETSSALAASELQRGLMGYWKFDSDGTAVDESGNGNDGVFVNASVSDGLFGKALDVKGEGDSHVSIPASPSLDSFTDQLSVSVWVYPRKRPSDFTAVVSRQIGTLVHPDQFFLGFGPRFGIAGYKWHSGTIENGEVHDVGVYAGFPAANRWIHLAGVYDGLALTLYVDGESIGSLPQTGLIQLDENPVTVGAEENGEAPQVVESGFNGLIDELRIYNRALSAGEIAALFKLQPQ